MFNVETVARRLRSVRAPRRQRVAARRQALAAPECLEHRCCPSSVDLWSGGTGNYSDGTKWSLGVAPNNTGAETYTAEIPAGSTVTLDMNATIDNLNLDAASSTLVMPDGSSLTIMGNTGSGSTAGSIDNAGTIAMKAAGTDTELNVGGGGTVTLGGGGTVTMSDSAHNLIGNQAAGTLVNVDNTIEGSGKIQALSQFVNQGTVIANQSTPLVLNDDVGSVTNSSTLEANGGTLVLAQTVNNAGGTLLAAGNSPLINLGASGESPATIIGGTLSSLDPGDAAIEDSVGAATLDGVTITAGTEYILFSGQSTTLEGTITNHGTIYLDDSVGSATLNLSGAVTLTGGGEVFVIGGAVIDGGSAANTLTNVDNTIQGAFQFTNLGTIVNQGTLLDGSLTPATLTIDNSGTLGSYGAPLFLAGVVNNTGGTILADGSRINLGAVTINGGTLTTQGNGFLGNFAMRGPTILNGVTISAGSTYTIDDSGTTVLEGTITNQGTILLAPNSNPTTLAISGSVTLTGGGTVSMTIGPISVIAGTGPGAVLNNGAGDPAQVRQLLQQRATLKDTILSEALKESNTSETLMKVLQDNGLWDLVTAPGADPTHAAQFRQALNTINANNTNDQNALEQRYAAAKLAGDMADMKLVQQIEDTLANQYQTIFVQLTSYQSLTTQIVNDTAGANTIEGLGQISGLDQLVNLGTIWADQPNTDVQAGRTEALAIQPSVTALDNLGLLGATNGAVLNLPGTVTNEGTAWADVASGIDVGTYTQSSGLTLVGPGGTFDSTSTFNQAGGSTTIQAGGVLTAPAFIQLTSDSGSTGITTVDGILATGSVTIYGGGILTGTGVVDGAVINSGTVFPGDLPTPGQLNITGSYNNADGTVAIALAGPDSGAGGFGVLNVYGFAMPSNGNGEITVSLVNGFSPTDTETFPIFKYAGYSGDFLQVRGISTPNVTYTTNYLATEMVLTAHVAAAAPAVTTTTPGGVSATAATLAASVNPMGSATTVYFIFGTDPTLGGGWTGNVTPAQSIAAGTSAVPATAPIGNLAPGTTYYARAVATNAAGAASGAIVAFTTASRTPTTPTPTPTTTPASPTPTASAAITTLASARYETVSIVTGKKCKKVKAIDLEFSAPLNAAAARNLGVYALLARSHKGKKHVVQYNKPVMLRLAIENVGAESVVLVPRKPAQLTGLLQLRINTTMLSDALSRPVNDGHAIVVAIDKSAFTITR